MHVRDDPLTGPQRIVADTVQDDPHEYPLGSIVHLTGHAMWWSDGGEDPDALPTSVRRYLTRDRIWVAAQDIEPYA